VVSIMAIYGQVVFFMTDSMWVSSEGASGITVRVVESDAGCVSPLGAVSARRAIYRPGEQGIYAFNGVSDHFRGDPVAPPLGTWAKVDPRFFGAINGVYWRERNQIIWAVRKTGDPRIRTRLALNLGVGVDQDTQPNVYTLSDGPDISSLGVVEDYLGLRRLLGSDYLGNIYELDRGDIDGPSIDNGSVTGTASTSATTLIVPVTETDLDVAGAGHRGELLRVVAANGRESTAHITSNTASQFTLAEALAFTPASGDSWDIGTFRRSWRTGFLPYGWQDEKKRWGWLFASFEPRIQGLLRVRAWVDFDETKTYLVDEVAMNTGWTAISLFGADKTGGQRVPRGKFLQLEFSCRHPFALYDYTLGERRSGPGR
jgi:hypothetical protein